MPIVVDEVVISIEVGASPEAAGRAPATPGADATRETPDVVALCVERVLEVLAQRQER